jgi:hypothetical protein
MLGNTALGADTNDIMLGNTALEADTNDIVH